MPGFDSASPRVTAGAVLAVVSHSTRFFRNFTSSDCNFKENYV